MKTLFITSFHAHISRNILQTSAYGRLVKTPSLHIVLLVPSYKVPYFADHFGGPHVSVEGLEIFYPTRFFFGRLFKRLAHLMQSTRTAFLRKRFQYHCDHRLLYFLASMFLSIVGKSITLRALVRSADLFLSPVGAVREVFARHQPNLVFATDVQNENDVSIMQEARRRGVKIIGMIRSWDNPSQRFLRVFPEKLLVGQDTLADEVVAFLGYPRQRVLVVGNPHYDRYHKAPIQSRETFFSRFGFEPKKPLILYAPVGDLTILNGNDVDQFVMDILGTVPAQVLVRFPPDEKVRLENFSKPPNMIFDRPGFVFQTDKFTNREITRDDDDRLIDSLYWSSVVVTGPTSICLDGAFLDRPVIAVNFYPTPRPFLDTIYQYDYNHIKKLLATGGVHLATSKEDFLKAVHTRLADPTLEREGRANIRKLWFSHADGRAGERLAAVLLDELGLRPGAKRVPSGKIDTAQFTASSSIG